MKWFKKKTEIDRLITFDDFVGLGNAVFKSIGMITYDEHPGATIELKFYAALCLSISILSYCVIAEVAFFVDTLGSDGYFLKITGLFPCIWFCLHGYAKLITMIVYRKQVTNLVYEMKRIFPKTPQEQAVFKVKEHYNNAQYFFRIFCTFMFIWIWTFNLFPLVISVFQYLASGVFIKRLPYMILAPYDQYAPGWYEFSYLCHIGAGHTAVTPVIAADIFVGGLLTQMCMHFDALKRRLASHQPREENAKEDLKELIECIKMQNILYKLVYAIYF